MTDPTAAEVELEAYGPPPTSATLAAEACAAAAEQRGTPKSQFRAKADAAAEEMAAASRIAAAQADRDAAVEQARAEARRHVAAGALAMPQHLRHKTAELAR